MFKILPQQEEHHPTPDTGATFTLDANDAVVFADGPVNVTNLDPDWQQATDLQEITDTEAGEVLKFSNFNYQGIEIVEQDLSGKEHLHLDVWSATDGTIKVGPVSVSTGEHLIEFNVIGGQWNAIDLDMADFAAAGKDLTDIHQIKFDTGLTPVSEFYVDNLAFTGTVTSTTPVVVTGPPAPAPSVTLVAGDIDLYVQADTNGDALGGVLTNPNPGWGQVGSAATIAHSSAGEVIHVQNLNYQGMEMVSTDVSGKTSMHIDLWSADSGAVKFFLVAANNGGEAGIVLDVIGGQWNSFDIDPAAFEPATSGEIFQLKLDSQSGAIGTKTPLTDFYMDNLYFGDQTPTIGSTTPVVVAEPQAPAPSVTLVAGDIDLYVQADTNGGALGGVLTNPNPGWGQAGSAATIAHSSAGEVIHVQNLNYQGMEMVSTDVSGKTSMHIDLWSADSGAVKFFLVAANNGGEAGIVLDVIGGQWNSFDIDLAAFEPATSGEIFQLKLDSQSGAIGTKTPLTDFYMDNLYFGDQTPTIGTPSNISVPISTVTLDFEAADSVNTEWAFGNATAGQTTHEGTGVLEFTHPATGAEAWAGATIAIGYGETDYIADRGSVTMRVWSENAGTVTLAMEDTSSIPPNAGATRYITDTQTVTAGEWNDLTFTFPASNAEGTETDTNYNQLVIKTDVGNTVYVDEIVMAGAEVHVDPNAGVGDPNALTTDYDETIVQHHGNADPSSEAKLTISKTVVMIRLQSPLKPRMLTQSIL